MNHNNCCAKNYPQIDPRDFPSFECAMPLIPEPELDRSNEIHMPSQPSITSTVKPSIAHPIHPPQTKSLSEESRNNNVSMESQIEAPFIQSDTEQMSREM